MSTTNERLLKSLETEFNKIKVKEVKQVDLDMTDMTTFTNKYVTLPAKAEQLGNKTWFEGRPWLPEIYNDESKRIVLVKGRQMEMSEWATNTLFYWGAKYPGKYIYASSSGDKADNFSRDRVQKQMERSSNLQNLVREQAVRRIVYNKSEFYFMTAYEDTKTLRSIDADGIILDEFQDYRANAIPIAEEGLRHSAFGRLRVIGTPLLTGTNFSNLWDSSTKKEWKDGKWEVTNLDSDGIWTGYHISQEFAVGQKPLWIPPEDFTYMRKNKPRQEFMNEVLGQFYSGMGRPTDYGYVRSLFSPAITKGIYAKGGMLLAGVDWGVSKANTVFYLIQPRLLELPDIYTIDTIYIEKIDDPDLTKQIKRVAALIKTFPITLTVLDYGSGIVQNQELYKEFGNRVMQAQLGNGKAGQPITVEPTAFGRFAKVNRTWAIDITMDYITKPERFRIYNETDDAIRDWIINDFLSEYPEASTLSGGKIWRHNPDTTDDVLMSCVNAMIAFQLQKRSSPMSDNIDDILGFT